VLSFERLTFWMESHGVITEVVGGKLRVKLPADVTMTPAVAEAIEAHRLRLIHPEGMTYSEQYLEKGKLRRRTVKHRWRVCDKCGAVALTLKDRPCPLTPGCPGKHRPSGITPPSSTPASTPTIELDGSGPVLQVHRLEDST